jgi:hypothetical protein
MNLTRLTVAAVEFVGHGLCLFHALTHPGIEALGYLMLATGSLAHAVLALGASGVSPGE